MDSFKLTEMAAWWGAIIATLVLAWDIYKWKTSGPKLRMTVCPNMKFTGIKSEDKTFVMVKIDNTGDAPTTITNLTFIYYENFLNRLRRKPEKQGMVVIRPSPGDAQPLPHLIKPGCQWIGIVEQADELEQKSKNGHLICQLFHSFREKPTVKRVTIDSPSL